MSTQEIESRVRELRQLQALIEEAQTEAEAIKDEIKAHMGDMEELRAGEYKITYKPITTVRIDTTALKNVFPEVVERFTKKTTVRRFQVA
jgi:predicted phage-related endonuclease